MFLYYVKKYKLLYFIVSKPFLFSLSIEFNKKVIGIISGIS